MTAIGKGTLRAYEVLKEFSDGSGSKIEALVNFLRPTLSDFDGQVLDIARFSDSINAQLHISVTPDTISDLLPLFIKKGWLVTEPSTRPASNIVRCPAEAIPDSKSDLIKELIPKFREFLTTYELPEEFEKSDENLFDVFSEFMISVTNIDDLATGYESVNLAGHADQVNFLCARFARALYDAHDPAFQLVEDIAQIALISDLVREFSKPTSSIRRTDARIYLDSPLILELIGASGNLSRDNIKTLLEIVRAKGAKVHVFDASIREACNSLSTMIDEPVVSKRYGATHDAMLRGEVKEATVRSIIQNCAAILREKFQIKVDQNVPPNRSFGHAEFASMRNDLNGIYAHQNSAWSRATHDAQAVACIMRMRKDHLATNDLWDSSFFFLTRNRKFKETARTFCEATRSYGGSGDFLLEPGDVGPVVDIREFASSVWLRFGAGNDDTLPRLHLLAGCERILRFNRKTLNKVRTHINRLSLSADANGDEIDQIQMLLMHPVGVMSVQDVLRGSDRQANYKSMLAAQESAEKERIAKGVEKGSAVIRAELKDASEVNERLQGEIEAARRRDLENQRIASEQQNATIKDYNDGIDRQWDILSDLIPELLKDNEGHNGRVIRNKYIYRCMLVILIPAIYILDKFLGSIAQGIPIIWGISPFIASVIVALFVLLPVQALLGWKRPKIDRLNRWVSDTGWIENLLTKAEALETKYILDLGIQVDEDGTVATKDVSAIRHDFLAANYKEMPTDGSFENAGSDQEA
jgi:hypothetical protein